MKIPNILKLIIAICVAQLAGIIGSFFTMDSVKTWYAGIARPDFAPPNWVFGPVWTTLFLLMGIAAFLVWKKGLERRDVRIALGIFVFQLILNTFWSIIFFSFQSPGWAFVELVFLWIAILATIVTFYKISKPAAWLLVPYILWVSFAGYLNYSIWDLNKVSENGNGPVKGKLVTGTEKETFSGKITAVDTGCFYDAVCSVSVDGKKIIVVKGGLALSPDQKVGKLIGVDSISDLEGKLGQHANVYATTTPEGDYSLYGREDYYIEILKYRD